MAITKQEAFHFAGWGGNGACLAPPDSCYLAGYAAVETVKQMLQGEP